RAGRGRWCGPWSRRAWRSGRWPAATRAWPRRCARSCCGRSTWSAGRSCGGRCCSWGGGRGCCCWRGTPPRWAGGRWGGGGARWELWEGEVERREARLEAVELRYADYASWQRERLEGEAMEREVAWWRERLEGWPQVLEVSGVVRPKEKGWRGGTVELRVEA